MKKTDAPTIPMILTRATGHRYNVRDKLAKTLTKKLKIPKNICKFCVSTPIRLANVTIRNFCSFTSTVMGQLFSESEVFIPFF